jgi:hypothetical protein
MRSEKPQPAAAATKKEVGKTAGSGSGYKK